MTPRSLVGRAIRSKGRRWNRSWAGPLAVAVAGAVIAPRIPPVRRALDTVVECSSGHLFSTLWFPLGSIKAVCLGKRRFQRCPVGRHWAIVSRADQSKLSPEQLSEARAHHDLLVL